MTKNYNLDFHAVFGHFINLYAMVESFLHITLGKLAKLDEASTRAIAGGMRLSDIITTIRRLAKPPRVSTEVAEEFDAVFAQLSHITKLRDALVHRGWDDKSDFIISSNVRTAKSLENVEVLKLNATDLRNASKDLGYILLRLSVAVETGKKSEPPPGEYLQQPWLYRPRPLEWPHRPSQKGSRDPNRSQ